MVADLYLSHEHDRGIGQFACHFQKLQVSCSNIYLCTLAVIAHRHASIAEKIALIWIIKEKKRAMVI